MKDPFKQAVRAAVERMKAENDEVAEKEEQTKRIERNAWNARVDGFERGISEGAGLADLVKSFRAELVNGLIDFYGPRMRDDFLKYSENLKHEGNDAPWPDARITLRRDERDLQFIAKVCVPEARYSYAIRGKR